MELDQPISGSVQTESERFFSDARTVMILTWMWCAAVGFPLAFVSWVFTWRYLFG